MLSVALLIIFLPVTFYYLYFNIKSSFPWIPYSYSRIHNPATWNPIVFLSLAEAPDFQWDGWVPISMGFLVVFFYGIGDEAIEIYRELLVKLGLGRLWPSLKRPRSRRRRSEGTWMQHFNLVHRALKYFEKHRAGGDGTGSSRGTTR